MKDIKRTKISSSLCRMSAICDTPRFVARLTENPKEKDLCFNNGTLLSCTYGKADNGSFYVGKIEMKIFNIHYFINDTFSIKVKL